MSERGRRGGTARREDLPAVIGAHAAARATTKVGAETFFGNQCTYWGAEGRTGVVNRCRGGGGESSG